MKATATIVLLQAGQSQTNSILTNNYQPITKGVYFKPTNDSRLITV